MYLYWQQMRYLCTGGTQVWTQRLMFCYHSLDCKTAAYPSSCLFFCAVQQNVMEQFNPGLRNLVNLGKNYEKSVTGKYLDMLYIRWSGHTYKFSLHVLTLSHVDLSISKHTVLPYSNDACGKGVLWCGLEDWRECCCVTSLQRAGWVSWSGSVGQGCWGRGWSCPNVDDSLRLVWNIAIRMFCTDCPGCLLAVTKQLYSFGVKMAGLSALACDVLTCIKQILIIAFHLSMPLMCKCEVHLLNEQPWFTLRYSSCSMEEKQPAFGHMLILKFSVPGFGCWNILTLIHCRLQDVGNSSVIYFQPQAQSSTVKSLSGNLNDSQIVNSLWSVEQSTAANTCLWESDHPTLPPP